MIDQYTISDLAAQEKRMIKSLLDVKDCFNGLVTNALIELLEREVAQYISEARDIEQQLSSNISGDLS